MDIDHLLSPGRCVGFQVPDCQCRSRQDQLTVPGIPAPGPVTRHRSFQVALPSYLSDESAPTGTILPRPTSMVLSGSSSISLSDPCCSAGSNRLAGLDVVGNQSARDTPNSPPEMPVSTLSPNTSARWCWFARLGRRYCAVISTSPVFCVQRDELRVGLLQKYLAITVGEPTVYRVATHHRHHLRVLLRLVLPDETSGPSG